MRRIISRNPFTGKINKEVDNLTNAQLEAKIKQAAEGHRIQAGLNHVERARKFEKLADVMQKDLNHYAEIITAEVGKPISQSKGEITKTINHCRYYAKHIDQYLSPTNVKTDAKKTLIKYEPLGIVYNILPFNFPWWLNFKGGIPTLALGNSIMARNSDSTPLVGEAIEEVFKKAGFDSGEYQNVFTSYDQLQYICKSDLVGGVSFTGSSAAGSAIAAMAGKYLKRSVMELGGNDPMIVLEDADPNLAAKDAVRGRCANAGQVCFSPKRFIIVGRMYEVFKKKLIENLKQVVTGDPMKETTTMGPLARPDLYDNLEAQLKKLPSTWKKAYESSCQKPFYPITVYEADHKNPYGEELFGPIFSLYHAENEAHAIQIANQGNYGLASSIYTGDSRKGEEIISRVRAGMAFVNEVPKSDSMIPTGGVGRSGFGREGGIDGFRSFANIKLYYVN